MGLTNLLILVCLCLGIAAIAYFNQNASNRKRIFNSAGVVLGILLLAYSSSGKALAAQNLAALGASDNALTSQQQQLEEDLKLTPGGGHYSGLEYSERTGPKQQAASDQTIKKSIKSLTEENVIVAVSNGSVRLSGTVKDKETAKNIVEQTKEIPGVHEITFDLGLDNSTS